VLEQVAEESLDRRYVEKLSDSFSMASTEAPIGSVDTCVLCMLPDDPNEMTYVKVHNDCVKRLLRAVRAEERARAAGAAP